jgi:hypothetical protein
MPLCAYLPSLLWRVLPSAHGQQPYDRTVDKQRCHHAVLGVGFIVVAFVLVLAELVLDHLVSEMQIFHVPDPMVVLIAFVLVLAFVLVGVVVIVVVLVLAFVLMLAFVLVLTVVVVVAFVLVKDADLLVVAAFRCSSSARPGGRSSGRPCSWRTRGAGRAACGSRCRTCGGAWRTQGGARRSRGACGSRYRTCGSRRTSGARAGGGACGCRSAVPARWEILAGYAVVVGVEIVRVRGVAVELGLSIFLIDKVGTVECVLRRSLVCINEHTRKRGYKHKDWKKDEYSSRHNQPPSDLLERRQYTRMNEGCATWRTIPERVR